MSGWIRLPLGLLALSVTLCAPSFATHDTKPSSYEFKQLLAVAAFTTDAAIANYQHALTSQLAQFGELQGKLTLTDSGPINFYDTKGCQLKSQGLLLRHRQHKQQEQLTLKLRGLSPQSVSHSSLMASGELQADVLATPSIHTIYSVAQSQPNSTIPANLNQLQQQFPALARMAPFQTLASQTLGEQALYPLSHFDLQQTVFSGVSLKLGEHKLKFSLTLWREQAQSSPLLAEISFAINNKNNALDTQSLQTAYLVLDKISAMQDWRYAANSTKTQWLYEHAGNLCDSEPTQLATLTPAK